MPHYDTPNQHVCFRCRKVYKKPKNWVSENENPKCPQCEHPMPFIGRAFRAPLQKNLRSWKVVEFLFQGGFRFHMDRMTLPKTMSEAKALVKEQKEIAKSKSGSP